MTSITTYSWLLLRSSRPRQWIKNLSLYAALIFSGFFFYVPQSGVSYFVTVTYAFVVFCVLTSSIYLINDSIDYQSDRHHPFKRKRPIAAGQLPIKIALLAAIVGLITVFIMSLWLPIFFKLTTFAYFGLQMAYAVHLKHLPILDVVSIATGFLLRVYAGAVVVNLHTSVWFLLAVVSASLFLAVGKRQSERTLLTNKKLGQTRQTLKRYTQRLLDQYTGMFANATWLTYAIFTFQRQPVTPVGPFLEIYTLLPRTLQSQKLLMLSVPFVILGVMRYLQLVYEDNEGESPERVLLRDRFLLVIVGCFVTTVFLTLYAMG